MLGVKTAVNDLGSPAREDNIPNIIVIKHMLQCDILGDTSMCFV